MTFLPKTKLGKWSVSCIILLIFFFLVAQLVVASGQEGGETFFDNLYISIPMLLAGISGIMALILGLISIIKSKERSPLVFIATIIGLLILVFLIGEFTVPH